MSDRPLSPSRESLDHQPGIPVVRRLWTSGGLLSRIAGSTFALNVAKIGGGTAVGQGLVALATPFITRLYGPGEMGLFGVFLAFAGFASVATGLRYELAIVSAIDDREAEMLLLASLLFVIPVSLLSAGVLHFMIRWNLLSFGKLPSWSALAAVPAVAVIGVFTALRYWYVRAKGFGSVSRALIAQGAGRSVFPLVLGLGKIGWSGLLIGEFAGRSFGIRQMLRGAWPALRRGLSPFEATPFRAALRRNWRFPVVLLPSSLIDAAAVMLPIPIISTLFGAERAGEFVLVQRLSGLPAALIGIGVADVFHSRLAECVLSEPARVRPLLLAVVRRLGTIALLVYVPVAAISPFLFGPVFGGPWKQAGLLMSLLSPAFLALLVVSPVSRLLMVVNRAEWKLAFDATSVLAPVVCLGGGRLLGYGFWICMAAYSVMSLLTVLFYFWLIWRASSPRFLNVKPPGA